MKIFVVHYNKLVERKKNIMNNLKVNNLEAEFVEQYDRDTLKDYDKKIFKNVDLSSMAISLSHLYCYKEIAEKYDYGLIFEDDAIFDNNFSKTLNKYLLQLPKDWDMLFIGNGCNLHIHNSRIRDGKYIYKKLINPATRCTDSYLINKSCASKIIDNINKYYYNSSGVKGLKIDCNIDWWLNKVIRNNKFNIYWAEPTIVEQGTQNGLYESSHLYLTNGKYIRKGKKGKKGKNENNIL